jgi:hypothetical protein
MIFFFQSEFEGIFEIIHMVILYCAFHNVNPCYCVVYIFMALMKMFQILVWFGLVFQNGQSIFRKEYYGLTILNIISLLFYIFAITFTFQAYREFKALEVEIIRESLSDSGASYDNYRVDYQNNAVINNNDSINPQPQNNAERNSNNNDAPYFRAAVPDHSFEIDRRNEIERVQQQRIEERNDFTAQTQNAAWGFRQQNGEARNPEFSRDDSEFVSFHGNNNGNVFNSNNHINPPQNAETPGLEKKTILEPIADPKCNNFY